MTERFSKYMSLIDELIRLRIDGVNSDEAEEQIQSKLRVLEREMGIEDANDKKPVSKTKPHMRRRA